jgi:hypothetical protein
VDERRAKWHKSRSDDAPSDSSAGPAEAAEVSMQRWGSIERRTRVALSLVVGTACLLSLGIASCGSAGTKSEKSSSPYAPAPDPSDTPPKGMSRPTPWTSTFSSPAMLIADEIQIEGPQGLLEHVAVRVDPEHHEQVQKTLPTGYLQQVTVKPGDSEAEITAQLDNLSITATRRLSVLERPGPVDLVVQARGRAVWHDLTTKQEKRAETMRLTGNIPR